MKTIKILGVVTCLFMTAITACGQPSKKAKDEIVKIEGKGFAVVELYTSEGCSSCPPADELIVKLQKEEAGKEVYLLAYHVDYWDRQGWKDIFSNADYTERQQQYAQWLNNPQIYTPQVIVNGKAEFIGSEESTIRTAIAQQLNEHSNTQLDIQIQQENKGLNVVYQVKGGPKSSILLIAVVQKEAQSDVKRGENVGRLLSHVQIVRKLQKQSLNAKGNGSVIVALPKDFNTQNFEILALVQDNTNGEILAATKADLHSGINDGK